MRPFSYYWIYEDMNVYVYVYIICLYMYIFYLFIEPIIVKTVKVRYQGIKNRSFSYIIDKFYAKNISYLFPVAVFSIFQFWNF